MPLRKLFSSNRTTSAFSSVSSTTIEPTEGVIANQGSRPFLRLFPYGLGNNNTTGSLEIIGWTQQGTYDEAKRIVVPNGVWVPTLIARVDLTLSAATGGASGHLSASERYADTITPGTVGATTRIEIASNAADYPAHLMVNPLSFDKIQVLPIIGTATSVNVLFDEMST